jgi:hypothetical protein
MRIGSLIVFLLCFVCEISSAQDKKLAQFSGIITTLDSLPVPYVTITNKTAYHQTHVANYKGYFSFVVCENDTLVFTAIGYKPITVIIPRNLPDQHYTLMLKMEQVVINLPAVRVYPWVSTDEFKKEFMTMKVADDDLEIAKKNVARKGLAASYTTLPRDGQEIQGFNFKDNHTGLVNKNINQRDASPLFNPFAWKSFLEQIFQGDKNRGKN